MESNRLMQLLALRDMNTEIFQKYATTPREYYPGEVLYMREVHVCQHIGLAGINSVSELAEKLGVTVGAVSQQLTKLQKKGFVKRVQKEFDRRQFSVYLTEKGKELCILHQKYDEAHYQQACALFQEFSEEDLAVIFRYETLFGQFIRDAAEEVGHTGNFPQP